MNNKVFYILVNSSKMKLFSLLPSLSVLVLLLCMTTNLPVLSAQDPEEDPNLTESGLPTSEPPRDDIYDRYMTSQRRILHYENLHEKDIMWEKRIWRTIDIREKRNHHFAFELNPFIDVLLKATKSGNVKAYQSNSDNFKLQMSPEEVKNLGVRIDTVYTVDPLTFEEKMEVVINELDPKDVKQFLLKEVYFFDEERSDLGVRILGMAPYKDFLDNNGNVKYSAPLFWVYYPELRPMLAKIPAFNEANDISSTTWEDIFEKRLFGSYIYKESNVYDRRVRDYKAEAIDRLYESDKIKDGIFHFEHDIWDY
jgi:gliding motility associated protien GldN